MKRRVVRGGGMAVAGRPAAGVERHQRARTAAPHVQIDQAEFDQHAEHADDQRQRQYEGDDPAAADVEGEREAKHKGKRG